MMKYIFISCFFLLCVVACKQEKTDTLNAETITKHAFTINQSSFGTTKEGAEITEFTFKAEDGFEAKVINYGGIITSLKVPDQNGVFEDVVLGFDDLSQYEGNDPYFGAIIGRFGNRIANGQFIIDGITYELEKNNGSNHLHGGTNGFHEIPWEAKVVYEDVHSATLQLRHISEDGAGGYPGTLVTEVHYTFSDDHSVTIDYIANTNKKTILNLTQHSYFNLSGDFQNDILDHVLHLKAEKFLPVDAGLIPTGEIATVIDTPMDFRTAKAIGRDIEVEKEQLSLGQGFDHCWVLSEKTSGLRLAATVHHPKSGRFMKVTTTEPSLQFYSGNFLNGTLPAKGGGTYGYRSGLCLETQHFPDSPNQNNFPSTILQPDETYRSTTVYAFSIQE